jgi:hypothetical protein
MSSYYKFNSVKDIKINVMENRQCDATEAEVNGHVSENHEIKNKENASLKTDLKNDASKVKKPQFTAGDRVKKIDATGCQGTVKEIKEETVTNTSDESKPKNLLIQVLWDNGTLSYFTPEALEMLK